MHTSSKSVLGVVGQLNHLVGSLERSHHGKWSKDLLLVNLHVWLHIGENGWLDKVSLVSKSLTTGDQRGTLAVSAVDIAENLVQLHLRGLCTLESEKIEWVSNLEGLSSALELLQHLVVDTFLNKHPGTSRAHFSRVVENTCNQGLDSNLDVSVVEHNVGRLSSKLQSDLLEVGVGSSLHDQSSGGSGSGEGNLLDLRVRSNGVTGDLTESRNNVHHSWRNTGFFHQLRCVQCRQWSALCGLQHSGVTGSKSRSNLPGPHQKWEVPWNDLSTNTNWLSLGVSVVGSTSVNVLTGQLVCPTSTRSDVVDDQSNVSLSQLQGLTVVKRLDSSQGLLVLLQELSKVVQSLTTNGRVDLTPAALKSSLSSIHGVVNVLLAGLVDLANFLFGRRVDNLKGLVLPGRNKFIVDEQTSRLFVSLTIRKGDGGGERVGRVHHVGGSDGRLGHLS
ncbi:hypothetical protein OGAPHI_007432 [Ogataea philodendri]|uniref:Uncharacterized protein n=1 Tax=Ogataea philodendri TaxID=1378263 RepID=A0A9P8NV55_9ASCO|nr:uncharacterized protein OGAPHI_007432 [Ogataea philodendri]KAH3660227.1 hypothetical protein OGAPHI_007432 [Ogataea philodendri]